MGGRGEIRSGRMICIDNTVTDKCWNPYDSYGEICVHCGCCSKDKETRYKSRILLLEELIENDEKFDGWVDGWREKQEENIKTNLKIYKRQLRYYKRKLEEVRESKCHR